MGGCWVCFSGSEVLEIGFEEFRLWGSGRHPQDSDRLPHVQQSSAQRVRKQCFKGFKFNAGVLKGFL